MINRNDVPVIDTSTRFGDTQVEVKYGDRFFVLGAVDMSEADIVSVMEVDPLFGLLVLSGGIPTKETYVMETDENGYPINECDENCATGVCNKRIATDKDSGDIDRAWSMFLAYLNA